MRVYSKILDGTPDGSALKPLALTDHRGGVPVGEIPAILDVSESSVQTTTILGATKGTFEGVQRPAYALLNAALDYRYDAIHVDWYKTKAGETLDRGDASTYEWLERFTIARQDFLQDTTDDAATGLQAHVSHSRSLDNYDLDRGFELARNSNGHLFVAESQNNLPGWVTIAQGDGVYVRFFKYESGIAGNIIGEIRASGIGSSFEAYVHGGFTARPSAVPADVGYQGGSDVHLPNPNNTGWQPLRTSLGTLAQGARAYIARIHFVRGANGHWSRQAVNIWPVEGSDLYLQYSADGTNWHTTQQAGDAYIRRRLHVRDAWVVERFDVEAPDPWVPLGSHTWHLDTANTAERRQTTFDVDFDLDDYANILLRWYWINRNNHAWIAIPSRVMESSPNDDFDYEASYAFSLLLTTDIMGGSASLRDARWGTGEPYRTQAFRMKLIRNSGDGIKRVRKIKLWDPIQYQVAGSGGTFYIQGERK